MQLFHDCDKILPGKGQNKKKICGTVQTATISKINPKNRTSV